MNSLVCLDIDAGGHGLKGIHNDDGTVSSCFKLIVDKYCNFQEKEALEYLVSFVDTQDSKGNACKFLIPESYDTYGGKVVGSLGINLIFRAIQSQNHRNDEIVLEKMSEILDGILEIRLSRQRAEVEANEAKIVGDNVAIVLNSKEYSTNAVLFERGIKAIVYVDGNNLGVVRGNISKNMKDIVKPYVDESGEDDWFYHPAGFLACRGSRKAPAENSSIVCPMGLAHKVSKSI